MKKLLLSQSNLQYTVKSSKNYNLPLNVQILQNLAFVM